MAAVPQKVLNWMYNVLKGEYHDPDRTYSDVAQTLAQYPGLSVRTSVYTYENGRSSLLLNVSGTLPTSFRGTTYMFPISLWIPHEYPRDVPMGFATPAKNMVVRAGQYVSGEGRIYHPYLAGWGDDRSNLLQLVSIIQEIFSREPPLIAKHEPSPLSSPRQIPNGGPPPVPPLPPEMDRPGSGTSAGLGPPPPPPKQYEGTSQSAMPRGRDGPPPVPPRPQQDNEDTRSGKQRFSNMYSKPPPPIPSSAPQRTSSLRHSFSAEPSEVRSPSMMQQSSRNDVRDDRPGFPRPIPPGDPQISQSQYVNQRLAPLSSGDPQLGSNQPQWDHQLPRQPRQQLLDNQYYQQHPHYSQPQIPNQSYPPPPQTQPPPPTPQPKKPPPTDLLTSPFDTPLPPANPESTAPAPPIPPNPQKDALLSHLSNTLTSHAANTHVSNITAFTALSAQQRALTSTLSSINSEISALESLSNLLASNEQILHSSMASADAVLADAKTRAVPDIDEVLVAPTRVEGQLYEVVCEERAVRDSRAFLGRCVDRGRVGGEVWARQTRALAREEFGYLVLGRKIARGLGLRVEGHGDGDGDGDGGGGPGGGGAGAGGEGWYR